LNLWYRLMERRHRWFILATIVFGVACLGAMMMIAYGWDHVIERIWFYALMAGVLYLLVQGIAEWGAPDRESQGPDQALTPPPRSGAHPPSRSE